jgi:membrane-associated phospholipid phosphatase
MINRDNLYEQLRMERPQPPSPLLFILLGLSAIALIVYTVLEIIFREKMFNGSTNFSYEMQQNTPNAGTISNVIGEILTALGIAYIVLALFLREKKLGPFRRFFTLATIIWQNVTMRLIYANIRPSLKSPALQSGGPFCEQDFGNPSGHLIMVTALYLLVYLDLREHWKGSTVLFDSIGLTIVAIVCFAVSFIRLYLGVHAYNQLILGALWAIFTVLLVEVLKKQINTYILEPIFYKEIYSNRHRTALITLAVIIVVYNIPAFVFFGIRLHTHGVGSPFYNEIANCLEVKDNYLEHFATKILAFGMFFNFALFMLLGLNDCKANVRKGLAFVQDGNIFKILLRFLVLILLAVPIIFAYLPQDNIVAVTVVRAAIIVPVDGYIEGRFLVPLLIKWRLVSVEEEEGKAIEMQEVNV